MNSRSDTPTGATRLVIAHTLTDAQVQELCALYQKEWWTIGRSADDVRLMLAGTDLVAALAEEGTGRLVAFARVLTDRVYKALMFDVIVSSEYRGLGVGRRLIETVLSHPLMSQVQHVELYCRPELVPFYRKWGFDEPGEQLRFMRFDRSAGAV